MTQHLLPTEQALIRNFRILRIKLKITSAIHVPYATWNDVDIQRSVHSVIYHYINKK